MWAPLFIYLLNPPHPQVPRLPVSLEGVFSSSLECEKAVLDWVYEAHPDAAKRFILAPSCARPTGAA